MNRVTSGAWAIWLSQEWQLQTVRLHDELAALLEHRVGDIPADAFHCDHVDARIARDGIVLAVVLGGETCIGLPCESTPSNVPFTESPDTSYVRVCLFGAGPELNFDFARFNFHVRLKDACYRQTRTRYGTPRR